MFLAGAIETDAERFIAAVRRSRDLHSFVYWLETTYTPKPTIQVVHVVVDRRNESGGVVPEVLVVSRQIWPTCIVRTLRSRNATKATWVAARRSTPQKTGDDSVRLA